MRSKGTIASFEHQTLKTYGGVEIGPQDLLFWTLPIDGYLIAERITSGTVRIGGCVSHRVGVKALG